MENWFINVGIHDWRNDKEMINPSMIISGTMGLGEKEIKHLKALDNEGVSKYLLLIETFYIQSPILWVK